MNKDCDWRDNVEKVGAISEDLDNHRVESKVSEKVSEITLIRNANKVNTKLIVKQNPNTVANSEQFNKHKSKKFVQSQNQSFKSKKLKKKVVEYVLEDDLTKSMKVKAKSKNKLLK